MSNSNGPGPPLLSLSLTPLPSPNVDDGARSRLWMCPLDMHDARLRSGATVALSRDSAAAAHAVATASKPLSRPPLWPLSPPPSSASSSALLPGSSIVLADAWPGPKLPRGKASPSRALAASLGLFQRREGSGGSNRGGGRSFSSSPAPPDTTDGVAVSLLAPPTGADADDYEASELVLRPLQEEEKEEENPGPRQLAALSALAARRAAGRSLLRGNVLAVPLLGRDAPLEVVRVVVVGSSSNASRRSLSGWEAARVGPRTKVRVVAASGGNSSGGDDDDNSESESESESEEDEDAAAVSPSSALHYGSDEDPLVAAAASAAAKAAERAVGGGPSGPAASAAAAAAAAGARALRGALFRARAASCTIAGGFAPLGGVDALAERLRGLVALPLCRPEAFPLFGLRAPAGAVLHGPPGTGKTALAVAAAADAALALEEKIGKGGERGGGAPVSLFVVGGAEVVRSAAGASEAGLRGIFAAARAAPGPSMVFLDEVDALAPARGGGGGGGGGAGSSGSGAVAPAAAAAAASGASARLSSALAAELDAVSASSSPRRVVVLAATNRLEAVDQALRRPGRLDAEVEVPPPGAEARAAILRSHLGRRASPASSAPAPASSAPAPASSDPPGTLRRHSLTDRDVRRLADAAHGFVGADLALLVREAASVALRRAVRGAEEAARRGSSSSCGDGGGGGGGPAAAGPPPAPAAVDPDSPDLVVSRGDFDAARRVVRPSAMRSVVLRLPRARWGDVGGQGAAKARLQEALQTTRRRPSPSSAADPSGPASATDADATSPAPRNPALLGVAPPAGILLYGPPGCSKTLLARAAARESGRNLFAVSLRGGGGRFFFPLCFPFLFCAVESGETGGKNSPLLSPLPLSFSLPLSLRLTISSPGQSGRAPQLLRGRLGARRRLPVQGGQGRGALARVLRRSRRPGPQARGGRGRRDHGRELDERGQREGGGAAAAGARRRRRARGQERRPFCLLRVLLFRSFFFFFFFFSGDGGIRVRRRLRRRPRRRRRGHQQAGQGRPRFAPSRKARAEDPRGSSCELGGAGAGAEGRGEEVPTGGGRRAPGRCRGDGRVRKRSFRSFASFPLRLPPSFCFPLVSFCIFDAREEEAHEAKSVARSLFPFQEPFCFQDVALLLNPTLIPHKNTSSKNEIQKHKKTASPAPTSPRWSAPRPLSPPKKARTAPRA